MFTRVLESYKVGMLSLQHRTNICDSTIPPELCEVHGVRWGAVLVPDHSDCDSEWTAGPRCVIRDSGGRTGTERTI